MVNLCLNKRDDLRGGLFNGLFQKTAMRAFWFLREEGGFTFFFWHYRLMLSQII